VTWLIDTDVLIEGERGNSEFIVWSKSGGQFATADIVRTEFLMGVYQTADASKRNRGEIFYNQTIAALPSLSNEPSDYKHAAHIAGEARRKQRGFPSIADGLLAAIALRTGATVATKNLRDFKGMDCPCQNPLEGFVGKTQKPD
jgi:predicted nucleic acid-binding protein